MKQIMLRFSWTFQIDFITGKEAKVEKVLSALNNQSLIIDKLSGIADILEEKDWALCLYFIY